MKRLTQHKILAASLAVMMPTFAAHAAINQGGPETGGDSGGGGGGGGGGGTPDFTWRKVYSKYDSFGSSSWGAGYHMGGGIAATPAAYAPSGKDTLEGNAYLRGFARLNGSYAPLFEVRTTGTTIAKDRTDLNLTAYVGGAAVYSRSYDSTSSTVTPLDLHERWPTTFVDRSVNVSVGPVPVTFRVKATGELEGALTGKISNVGLEASATPSGTASLYASAAIGGEYCALGACVGASAGVYADVTLLEASAPATAAIWWSLARAGGVLLNFATRADLNVGTLDGELGVFAEVSLGGTLDWHEALIDWDGFDATYNVFNQAGSHCLVGTCTFVGRLPDIRIGRKGGL